MSAKCELEQTVKLRIERTKAKPKEKKNQERYVSIGKPHNSKRRKKNTNEKRNGRPIEMGAPRLAHGTIGKEISPALATK